MSIKTAIASYTRLPLGALSVFLTAASVIVHIGAYIGIVFANNYYWIFSLSYVIHVLIFIPFIAMVFQMNPEKNKTGPLTIRESFNPAIAFKRFFPNTGYRIGILLAAVFVYVFFNFYFSTSKMSAGAPHILDGKYVLSNHGKITEIDQAQYIKMCYLRLKAFSGHWIIFSLIPLIYFLDRKKGGQTK